MLRLLPADLGWSQRGVEAGEALQSGRERSATIRRQPIVPTDRTTFRMGCFLILPTGREQSGQLETPQSGIYGSVG
jgi:hypothetical protein